MYGDDGINEYIITGLFDSGEVSQTNIQAFNKMISKKLICGSWPRASVLI